MRAVAVAAPRRAFVLLAKATLAPKVVRYTVHAPEVARAWRAGQFVIVRPRDDSERIPLTDQFFLSTDPVYTVDFCAGTAQYTGDVLTGLILEDDPDSPGDYGRYDMSALPGIQYGCYLVRTYVVLDPELTAPEDYCDEVGEDEICVQVTEEGYVRGDWVSTRT